MPHAHAHHGVTGYNLHQITSIIKLSPTCKDFCCIFQPAFGCCAPQTLVKIVIFSVFSAGSWPFGKWSVALRATGQVSLVYSCSFAQEETLRAHA